MPIRATFPILLALLAAMPLQYLYAQQQPSEGPVVSSIFSSSNVLIAAVLIMFGMGLWFVNQTLKRKEQGFGPNSVRALGIVIFIPALIFVIGYKGLPGEAIAALLGTLAGYVFSPGKSEDQSA